MVQQAQLQAVPHAHSAWKTWVPVPVDSAAEQSAGSGKLADQPMGIEEKLPDLAVGSEKLPDLAAGSEKLPDLAAGSEKLPDAAVGSEKLSDLAAGSEKMRHKHSQSGVGSTRPAARASCASSHSRSVVGPPRSMPLGRPKVKRLSSREVVHGSSGVSKFSHPRSILDDTRFDTCVAVLVVVNALLLGAEIEHEATTDHESAVFVILEYVFTCIFTLELLFRAYVRRMSLFEKPERHWAIFDTVLVVIGWVDALMTEVSRGMEDSSDGNTFMNASASVVLLKLARMVRIMRIIRVIRFLTSIRTMAVMIIGSMVSLFWLFILLFGVVYAFAVVLTGGATDWLKKEQNESHQKYTLVQTDFGSMRNTMYTLFLSICGGVSWGEPADRALVLGHEYFSVFGFFIFLTFFSILNIVTGVFVDSAIQLAESDRSVAIHKALRAKEGLAQSLMELMDDIDADKSGCITWTEWETAMKDKQISTAVDIIGVNTHQAAELFHMIDVSGDGLVSIPEFLDGMSRLKGTARSLDLHRVIAQNNRLLTLLDPKARGSRRSAFTA